MNLFRLNTGHSRIFGLDLLRFSAIMFVVIGHSMILIPKNLKGYFQPLILDGVSIFFVLSGFLIGGILIKQLEKRGPSLKLLISFWNRRWLRTLPMYFLILIILVAFTYTYKPERLPENLWRYFFFLQNFFNPQPAFFSESWSLTIEEWFYILIPSLLFISIPVFKISVKKALVYIIILIIISVSIYRLYAFQNANIHHYKEGNRFLMQVSTRLDSIVYGVLAAFTAYYYPLIWQKLNRWYMLIIGLILLYTLKIQIDTSWIIWTPVLKSLAVIIMLPYLSNWKTCRFKIEKVITHISLISYSMYLINLNVVIFILIKFGMNNNLRSLHEIDKDWLFEYGLFWILTLAISHFTYKFIEVPFMEMRKSEN